MIENIGGEQIKETVYYAHINEETNTIDGFYCKEIHGNNIPNNVIAINEELWQYLLSLGQTEVNLEILSSIPVSIEEGNEEFCYSMDCRECFSRVIQEQTEPRKHVKSELEMRVDILTDTVTNLTDKMNVLIESLGNK